MKGIGDTKKSYLASIESLDDADDTDDDSLGIIRMIRAKVNGCAALSVNSFQGGSPNQQSHHSSQSQSSELSVTGVSSEPHKDQPSHIERVILEIVETERQYVNDLQEIIQVCIALTSFLLIAITLALSPRNYMICIQSCLHKSCAEHSITYIQKMIFLSYF